MKRSQRFFHQLLLYVFLLSIFSCHKLSFFENVQKDATVKNYADFAEDIKIPVQLWDLIEGKVKESSGHGKSEAPKAAAAAGGGHGGGGASSEGSTDTQQIIFAPARVYLVEKNEGVLTVPQSILTFARGGGKIDLSDWVSGQVGSFYFGLDIPDIEGLTDLKIYYVSQARKRKIDQEIVGAGCNVFFDITTQFLKAMKGQGLKVNSSKNRHLSVLAGHYILVGKKDKQTLVSQITLTDSKNPSLLCEVTHESNTHL